MDSKINKSWFYFPIIILGIYFIYRLIDQSQIINTFPLDYTNDASSYMAILFFLAKYGFHSIAPNWYNGYSVLLAFPPGWFFFTLPLYWLTKDVKIAAFISLILMYIILFILIFFIGKIENISKIKRVAFFLFLFANPIAIGNFIRLGRYVELFGWVSFTALSLIIFYYKDKNLNKKFLWFIPVYGLLMISHPSVVIPAHFFIVSLLLVKKIKEKLTIILSMIAGAVLSSFWLIPFAKTIFNTVSLSGTTKFINELLYFDGSSLLFNIAGFIIIFGLWILFYYYWLSKDKSIKEIVFFSPIFILSLIFISRLIIVIPVLNSVFPDVYLIFFMFFTIFYFLSIKKTTIFLKNLVFWILIIFPILGIIISVVHTPFFIQHGELEKDTLLILQKVDDKFLFMDSTKTSYAKAYYSFAPIYYNLSTADGWSWTEVDQKYLTLLKNNRQYLKNEECLLFVESSKNLNVTDIVGYYEDCNRLERCKISNIVQINDVCLYRIE